MKINTYLKIKNDPNLQRYIRENSYWYKLLNRNPNLINKMIENMKKDYRLTVSDKIDSLNSKINLLKTLMDTFK